MGLPVEKGLLFVHTHKTAGTSFRNAIEYTLGLENMLFDYGEENVLTSGLIKQHLLPRRNFFDLGQVLSTRDKYFCLSGHFSLPKYTPLFPAQNVITFFRDPIQRFISSYEHHKRFNGLDMSLEAYCSEPEYANIQSKVVAGYPLGVIGFIGLQENYSESLQMIRDLYDIEVTELLSNVNEGRAVKGYDLDDEMLALAKQKNNKDMALHVRIQEIVKQRQEMYGRGLYYTHGFVGMIKAKQLSGWATNVQTEAPVEIEIKRNGSVVATRLANQYRPALREKNVNRFGFVGIDYTFERPLTEDDFIECVVAETQQILLGKKYLTD